MKIEYFCPECDGTNVRCMCEWDNETQQWVIEDGGENWCDDCDEELRKNLGKRTSMRGGKVRLMQEIKSE